MNLYYRKQGALKATLLSIFILISIIFSGIFISPAQSAEKIESQFISGNGVSLDTNLYLPNKVPAPAVILAHGFGGTKDSESELATKLQKHGYVVLTYSARGFGKSTGQINMDSINFEVADAKKLVDFLQTRTEVQKDQSNQAIVGVSGGSYGGALALMLTTQELRIKAVAADITWNDLNQALFPQNAAPLGQNSKGNQEVPVSGPFKKIWAGTFFNLTSLQNSYLGQCGNFSEIWCKSFKNSMAGQFPDQTQLELLKESSPSNYLNLDKVPTLLMQGQNDSLFPLSESLKNATQILHSSSSNSVSIFWHAGGHDGGNPDADQIDQLIIKWFDKYLLGKSISIPGFIVTDSKGTLSVTDSTAISTQLISKQSPLNPIFKNLPIDKNLGPFFSPIGGVPAALSSLPVSYTHLRAHET